MDVCADGPTLVLVGTFDVRSTERVRRMLYEHIEDRDDDVAVDMSAVEAVDVTALRVLAAASQRVERDGRHLVLRGCRPAVRRMLHLSRLRPLVQVEPLDLAV